MSLGRTYFFLADFAPHSAAALARGLAPRGVLLKPLGDAELGPGFMRVTTALPEENEIFLGALAELLAGGRDRRKRSSSEPEVKRRRR